MGGGLLLVGKSTLGLGHMAGDTGLFAPGLFDLQITDSEAAFVLFVGVTSHTDSAGVVVLIAVVYIMVGGAGGLAEEPKEVLLLFEDYFLPFLFAICRKEIPLLVRKGICIALGMCFYVLYLMAGLAGDGFGLLDRIVRESVFA